MTITTSFGPESSEMKGLGPTYALQIKASTVDSSLLIRPFGIKEEQGLILLTMAMGMVEGPITMSLVREWIPERNRHTCTDRMVSREDSLFVGERTLLVVRTLFLAQRIVTSLCLARARELGQSIVYELGGKDFGLQST